MPTNRQALRRLSAIVNAKRHILGGSHAVDNNSIAYLEYLRKHGHDPRMTDEQFHHLDLMSDDYGDVSDNVKQDLFDRFSIPAPYDLWRGESVNNFEGGARLSAPGPRIRGFTPTTMEERVARAFARGHQMVRDPNEDLPTDPVELARMRLAAINNLTIVPGLKALPLPLSGESEFALHPNTKKDLLDETVDKEDPTLLRRMYYLRRKYGGRVSANT
jgi:hypothetical protein